MDIKPKVVYAFVILMILSTFYMIIAQTAYAQQLRRSETFIEGGIGAPTLNWNPFAPGGTGGMEWGTWHLLYPPSALQNTLTQDWLLFLIDRIEFNGSDITITIHIRDEAKWSDGTPITSNDLIEGYRLSRQIGAGLWGDWCIYNYEIIDDKTLKYYIARSPGQEPPPREEISLDWLGGPIGCVLFVRPVPVHVFRPIVDQMGEGMRVNWRNDDPAKQVVAGPFKLYYADATTVIYERIDNWWGKDIFGLPKFKYLQFVYFKDVNLAISALVNGDVDGFTILGGLFVPNVEELKAKYGIKTWSETKPYFIPSSIYWLYLNLNNRVFSKVEVRKAIAWAIPWKDITEYGLLGLVEQAPVVGFVAEGVYKDYVNHDACMKYWGNPDCLLRQNITKAKQLLEKVGAKDIDKDGILELPDGTKMKFTILTVAGDALQNNIASLIADALKDIGIQVTVQAVDYRVWWQNFQNGQFDATLCWSAGAYEVGHVRNSYGNALYASWGNMAKWIGYSNDRLNALFEEMMRSLIDPEREKELAYAIQEILFEDLPSIPLYYTPMFWVYNTKYWDGWPNAGRPWWIPSWWGSLPLLFFITPAGQPIEKPWWLKPYNEGGAIISMSMYNEYLRKSIYSGENFVVKSGKPSATTTSPVTTATTTTPPTTSPATTTPPATSPKPTQTQTVATPIPTPTVTISKTITATITSLSTIISATTSISPTTVIVTDWTTTTILAVVLLIVGIAIGWIIKRK
ncbi:MAG: ABC transporter substrate-binding protein [Ignisphaera sp.]